MWEEWWGEQRCRLPKHELPCIPAAFIQQSWEAWRDVPSRWEAGGTFAMCWLLCPSSLAAILATAHQVSLRPLMRSATSWACLPRRPVPWEAARVRSRWPALTAVAPHSVPGAALFFAPHMHPAGQGCVRRGLDRKRGLPPELLRKAVQGRFFPGPRSPTLILTTLS